MIDHQEVAKPTRRLFLGGLGAALVAGPSIVRAASLMPVKAVDLYDTRCLLGYDIRLDGLVLRVDRALHQMERERAFEAGYVEVPLHLAKKLMPLRAFTMTPEPLVQMHMDRPVMTSELAAHGFTPWRDGRMRL